MFKLYETNSMQVSKNIFGFFFHLVLKFLCSPIRLIRNLRKSFHKHVLGSAIFLLSLILFSILNRHLLSLVLQTLSIQNLLSAITSPYIMSLQKVVAAWLHESEHSCGELGSVQLAFSTVFHNKNKKHPS